MDGEVARAVVRSGARMLRVRIGDDIEGWRVSQIEGRKVVLSLDDHLATFTLFSDDRDRQKSARGPMPGGEPKSLNQQSEMQQGTAPTMAPTSDQPVRRRRSRG